MLRNIVVGVILLILLGGAYIFVSVWEPAKDNQEDLPQTEIICVTDEEDVSEITVKNESGEYILSFKEDNGNKIYDISSAQADDKNESAISSSFNAFKKIYAMREISSDKGGFGFEESKVSLVLKKGNGEDIEVVFGNEVPSGGEFYCINKKDNKIYTVSDTMYNLVTQPVDYYRNKSVIAISDVTLISSMEVYEDGKPELKLRYTTEEENSKNLMPATWTLEYPWKAELENDKTGELLEKLSNIYGTSFAKDEGSYKYKVNITANDKTYSFEVAEGDTVAYVKKADNGYVYTVDKEVFETLDSIDPLKYISRFANLVNIEDMKKVTVSANGKEYTMDAAEGKYKINGSDTDEKEFKKKYQTIIGLTFIDFVEDVPKGEPYMILTFEMKDGKTATTKIYDYTEREYLAECINGTRVKILKSDLKNIEDLM